MSWQLPQESQGRVVDAIHAGKQFSTRDLIRRVADQRGARAPIQEDLMDAEHYVMEASLYYAKSADSKQKALVFRRFARAAEAIRFAVEDLAPKLLDGCSLEVSEGHYFGREIRPLYDDRAYPLRRRGRETRQK